MNEEEMAHSIAIIGMSGRFPGAQTIDEFWRNLCAGIESITTFSLEDLYQAGISDCLLNKPNYVRSKGILENIEYFDADFFGFSEKEAAYTDPQHRLFLECSWEALEDAGYPPDGSPKAVGVFGGTGLTSYLLNNLLPNHELQNSIETFQLHIGNDKDFLTTRVSHKFNLTGPSMTIQTACSTSLAAVCIACNHLLTYQCDMALAGAASISLPQTSGYLYHEGMILSPDGRCRPFDAQAKGTVMSNGVGVVALKRLSDAIQDGDHIYAVLRGYGLNNDGSRKLGYSAPSIEGQAEAIASAIAMAGISPKTISYIETHGTATLLGDPVEIKGLMQVMQHTEPVCLIGSVKSNIGHTVEAAGIAGLIKTALALYHRTLPPTLHFEHSNPHIDFQQTPFKVNCELKKWEIQPRRAGVSSFGIGGTNAHVILEEWPQPADSNESAIYFLVLSAKSLHALTRMANNLGNYLQKNPHVSLRDVAYTLKVGRRQFEHRRCVACSNREEAIEALLHFDPANYPATNEEKEESSGRKISLPTYPFEKKRFWINPPISEKQKTSYKKTASQSLEASLVEIWKDCLGKKDVDINDDFYEIGGDSLAAIQIAAHIQQKLGIRLGSQAMLSYRSIAKLTQALSQQIVQASSLVHLKSGDSSLPPLFFLHTIEGTLYSYQTLINALCCPNPIYGLQSLVSHSNNSIEEMAASYIKEIKNIQPSGPYYLFGMSFGGLIAYEMARQLKGKGESIGMLAMADIVKPNPNYLPIFNQDAMLAYLLELLKGEPVSQELSYNQLIQDFGLEQLPHEEQVSLLEVIKNHLRCLSCFEPKSYSGNILFFEAKNRFFRLKDLSFASTWKQLVTGVITVDKIDGNHLTMMMSPQVQTIAARLNKILYN